jgi:hypothetical protein
MDEYAYVQGFTKGALFVAFMVLFYIMLDMMAPKYPRGVSFVLAERRLNEFEAADPPTMDE